MKRIANTGILVLLLGALSAPPVLGQEAEAPGVTLDLCLCGWLPSLTGDAALFRDSIPLDVSLGEILGHLESLFEGSMSVTAGKITLGTDITYGRVGVNDVVVDSVETNARNTTWLFNIFAAYSVLPFVQLSAGTRYFSNKTSFNSVDGGPDVQADALKWWKFTVGTRIRAPLTKNEKFLFMADADAGFNAGTDWWVEGGFRWRFVELGGKLPIGLNVGYRYFKQRYDPGHQPIDWDVEWHGFVVGLSIG